MTAVPMANCLVEVKDAPMVLKLEHAAVDLLDDHWADKLGMT